MKAILSEGAFSSAAYNLDLAAIFRFAVHGRHRVEVPPSATHAFAHWNRNQSGNLAEECEFGLQASAEMEAFEPATVVVRISDTANLNSSPVTLTPRGAADFLAKPACVLVENSHADKAFLLTVAGSSLREKLSQHVASGWLEFEQGGGLGELKKRVDEVRRDPLERLRYWVLFDSDALVPGKPSAESARVASLCAGAISYCQLGRRTIENYLPNQALAEWAAHYAGQARRAEKTKLHRAYSQLAPEKRHHYNMKAGLAGDSARPESAAIWQELSGPQRDALKLGYSSKIGDIFGDRPPQIHDHWLREEGVFGELSGSLANLAEHIR